MDLKRDPRARSKSPKAGRKTQRPRGVESERRLVARRLLERGTPTEGALRFKSILDRATEVIGREREAFCWLGTPVRDLSYKTPISLLANERGRKAVLAVLTRVTIYLTQTAFSCIVDSWIRPLARFSKLSAIFRTRIAP